MVGRPQTQQRAVSAWGVPQCGHRQLAIGAIVAARARGRKASAGRGGAELYLMTNAAVSVTVP